MKTFVIILSDRWGCERNVTVVAKSIKEALANVRKFCGEFVLEFWEV